MSLAVREARVSYRRRRAGPITALDGVTLEVGAGELVAVVGASGSGKSTLLRAVAGLVHLDSGSVTIGGRDVTGLAPGARTVALVPQELPLYPHLDVAANIAFGEAARRTPLAERAAKIDRAVAMLGLAHLLDRRPESLSGGERQRIALARALVRRPSVFLLDEPLSGLDGATRLQLRADIRRVQQETGTAMLYVTHDPQEAMAIGDRVAVLAAGHVEQCGPPAELFARPATVTVARLVGPLPMNLLLPHASSAAAGEAQASAPSGSGGRRQLPVESATASASSSTVGVRPERVRLVASGAARRTGVVTGVELMGEHWLVRLSVGGAELLAVVVTPPQIGAVVGASWDAEDEHLFDGSGRRAAHTGSAGWRQLSSSP